MLQIRIGILVILLAATGLLASGNEPEWLLEDAFEKEILYIDQSEVVFQTELNQAIKMYNAGQFRFAAVLLEKVRKLNLPDGQLDLVAFVTGECNRQLGIHKKASEQYRFILQNFPSSEMSPPALYRILEYAADERKMEQVDSVFTVFQNRFNSHPLFNSVLYVCGVMNYKQRKFGDALDLLSKIPANSRNSLNAQFVTALCFLHQNELEKSLMTLEQIRKSQNPALSTEATSLIGDIYYQKGNFKTALEYYRAVPRNAKQYQHSLVKTAGTHLDMEQYEEARDIALRYLDGNKNTPYYFEMASILEQAYTKLGNLKAAGQLGNLLYRQIINARLKFEVFDEIDRLTDLSRAWQIIEYQAIKNQNATLLQKSLKSTELIRNLQNRLKALLDEVDPLRTADDGEKSLIPDLAGRRYLSILKEELKSYEDSIRIKSKELEEISQLFAGRLQDSSYLLKADSTSAVLNGLLKEKAGIEHEVNLVMQDTHDFDSLDTRKDEELQAKFVDWAFMKYQDKEEELKKMAFEIAQLKKNREKSSEQSLKQGGKDVVKIFNELDTDRLKAEITDDRARLVEHINTMINIYPRNRFNPEILFRLAELYFDEAGDKFESDLREYEKTVAAGDSATFPDYRLEKTIDIYNRIISGYPGGKIADDAMFYKAMALQKQGMEEEAISTLKDLVQKYPEGEFFVEANMNIGRYYFDHPRIENDNGYNLAMDAFRKVLFYRDHPQFVQALYHLGWCYYMQDNYDEAIAVFKYMIEESDLDFDPSMMEEKQISNPLLRAEAIDYIAISFDESGNINESLKFLKLVGNTDYSALVLKRIGELREEDLDFKTAIDIYNKLLEEYPYSRVAPEVNVSLVKLYESQDMPDSALVARTRFSDMYSKGGQWQKQMAGRDKILVAWVDSMAISIGLYVADESYRSAEISRERRGYQLAAENYSKLVQRYPDHPGAAEARWNLAVILDTRLQDKPEAYNQYVSYSRLTMLDSARREQSALNAIAIAQSLLPPDSLVKEGSLDFAGLKVFEAINNYVELFPSGSSMSKVLMSMGAIYFNRHMFTRAIEVYEKVIQLGPQYKEYYEALLFSGQCHFGQENWPAAIKTLSKVWKESGDKNQQESSFKLLLQAEFLHAKKWFTVGDFQNAASAFTAIEQKYPGSEYGDVVLFNAAESFEKMENWTKACDRYSELVNRYPRSKLAPDALFNAAGDYEKADKYNKAAESYEIIVDKYPESEKAKDALFNLGFCYEKTGKLDKVAEVNERYSSLYPEEKDVESMLLRSAAFYVKAQMYDKAVTLYRNFVRRFPKSPKTMEALFMTAKCSYEKKDMENAQLGFQQVELQNNRFVQDGMEPNNYYAAEAAFYLGNIKREQFVQVKLQLPENQLKNSLKIKTDLLTEAAKAYQRVIQYQSERMFEAAYKVGQLYEELSESWRNQERPRTDEIKGAILEKEILTLSSQLLQKSFIPYKKAIEISGSFDSLGSEQIQWVKKSSSSLTNNFSSAGQQQMMAIQAMKKAPVPGEIKDKPLHYHQYLKQLYETLIPLKARLSRYYSDVLDEIDSMKLSDSSTQKCEDEFVYVNYLTGSDFDSLSMQILKSSGNVSGKLDDTEKEDLLFQLEDIVFELQDNAIFAYEDAIKNVQNRGLQKNRWYGKIIESLARLSPDKYGTSFYHTELFKSSPGWIVRADSVEAWNGFEPPSEGWEHVRKTGIVDMADAGKVPVVWGDGNWRKVYLWKNIYLNGIPRDASVSISSNVKYRLFLNGTVTISDSTGNRGFERIDSVTSIGSLVRGGDNVICIEAEASDSLQNGIAVVFTAMIDTTQKCKSSINLPSVLKEPQPARENPDLEDNAVISKEDSAIEETGTRINEKERSLPGYAYQYKNHGELLRAIKEYQDKEALLNSEIKKERLEIQRLYLKSQELDAAIKRNKEQIDAKKLKIESVLPEE